ncbi:glycosyl transferase [Arthrobacter sp. GMC3]|uniref:glycosyl transferase n=1 Tax=Arthrobacter sp. GMC3 TaxID=2058894 RepID=UPI0015E3DA12|nr:glycosyl transferase [Arthrobacter sp. GMC3]
MLFSFKRALFGSYDVFHVHWPEVIYTGNGYLKGIAREVLTALVLTRIQLGKKPLVRTRHNLAPHSGSGRRQMLLEAWFDRLTTVNIRLNDVTVTSSPAPTATISHGDYQTWFAPFSGGQQVAGRIAYFGLIRQYKGVDRLLSSFLQVSDPAMTLTISGSPASNALREELILLAGENPRIDLDLNFLTDAELVEVVTEAELIVLPYLFMHNSGAALTALSLNRPVLVPDTEVNRRLSDEVGPGWVYRYDGQLDAGAIEFAIRAHRTNPPLQGPELSARSWDKAGTQHVQVFEGAVQSKKQEIAPTGGFHYAESASG